MTETEFTSSLVSHLYGVFPTHGFPNDTLFPATYSIGEVVLENSGCAVNNKVAFFILIKKLRFSSFLSLVRHRNHGMALCELKLSNWRYVNTLTLWKALLIKFTMAPYPFLVIVVCLVFARRQVDQGVFLMLGDSVLFLEL